MPLGDDDSQVVWKGDSWSLRVHTLSMPDGSALRRGTIEHPGAVVLIPLRFSNGQPELVMVSQYRLAIDETILELPAGTRGRNETWLSCAQRELREETGYRAENFFLLGEFWPAPGLSSELMKLYLATDLTPDPLPQDADEVLAVQQHALSELVPMAKDGRLRDAKTIVGILRAADYLEEVLHGHQ